jgi:iron complex outermembrane recepter protein
MERATQIGDKHRWPGRVFGRAGRHGRGVLLALVCLTGVAAVAGGSTNELPADFTDLSIEELINLRVTSVSKKETVLSQSAAAIAVVTQDDIRRLGVTSLPEALRLVPGMDVAQINSHEWAVSARGFSGQFANKLLVMVDGRSVYGTGFGGVVWGVQDVLLEDLDRIEVIRGPGGTLWGANAVNGVVNIITKSARETQGTLISTAAGTLEQPATAIRYGGQLATNLYYRAYAKFDNRDGFLTADGEPAPDNAQEIQGGFRMDWEPIGENKLTLQADYYANRVTENQDMPSLLPPYSSNYNEVNNNSGGNVLGRWTHDFSERSSLTAQAYFDHFDNKQAEAKDISDTVDFDVQHRFALGERHDIVWGLGYRHLADELRPSFFVSWNPVQHEEQLFGAFVQDEITMRPDRLKVTVGTKFEHNDYTGFEFQPGVRLLWTPTEKQTVWAAVSRAVRTPSRTDLNSRANYQVYPSAPPTLVSVFGDPNLDAEELIAYELGYRIELGRRWSLDLAGFYNDYDNIIASPPTPGLPTPEASPAPPHLLIANSYQNTGPTHAYGAEMSARWNATDYWHLYAGYSWLRVQEDAAIPLLGAAPEHQFQLRSQLELPGHLEFNNAVYFVDSSEVVYGLGQTRIPSYIRCDAGLVWHPKESLEIGVWGQNLFDDRHAEFTSYKTTLITEIPRSVLAKITWRF